MTEETTIRDEIKALNANFQRLIESGKVKGVKLKGTPSKSQAKKNFIYVLYIQDNGEITPMKVQVEEGTTSIEGAPRLATSHYRLTYKGLPTIIQPAWSSEPFDPTQNYEETVRDKMLAAGYRLLANRVELGMVKAKKKISPAVIIAIVAVVLVAGYFLLR